MISSIQKAIPNECFPRIKNFINSIDSFFANDKEYREEILTKLKEIDAKLAEDFSLYDLDASEKSLLVSGFTRELRQNYKQDVIIPGEITQMIQKNI